MKKLSRLIYMLAVLPFLALSCVPEEAAVPGEPEVENCYKVYFPTPQLNATDHTLEPTAATTLSFIAMREVADYEINVPVVVTCTGGEEGENVFNVSEIAFKDGQTETTFTVDFPDAQVGVTYDCTVEVVDPEYALKYGTNPTYVSFSVTRVKWNRVTGANGEQYGMFQDDILSSIFGVSVPYAVNDRVEVYQRDDKKGIYKFENLYSSSFMGLLFNGDPNANMSSYVKDVDFILDMTDPAKVVMPFQEIGVNVNNAYGWIMAGSLISDYVSIDPSQNLYGVYENGIVTFPANGLFFYFPNSGDMDYVNSSGFTKFIMPGYKDVDYNLQLAWGAADDDGVLPFQVLMGADVVKVKYAAFEGELFEGDIKAKASEITTGAVASKELAESGIYGLTLDKTGQYTLVVVGYNAAGDQVAVDGGSFGYVAAGDSVPVVLNCGLISSDKNAPIGMTAENSFEFYVYGEDIKQAWMALYRYEDFLESPDGVMNDVMNYPLSDEDIKAINGNGLTDIYVGLNSGFEYVLVVYAYNGYETELFSAYGKTAGEPDPLQMTYAAEDVVRADEKADFFGKWAFYSGTPQTNGRSIVGPVHISDGGNEIYQSADGSEELIEYFEVSGVFSPAITAGLIEDDTMYWQYYNGFIVPLHAPVAEVKAGGETFYTVMLSFCSSGYGGPLDGVIFGGFTPERNVAFVDMGLYADDPQGGNYLYTSLGVFLDPQYQQYDGDVIQYDDMMFVDMDNVPEEHLPYFEDEAAVSSMDFVKDVYQKDFNYIELPGYQLRDAIDKVQATPKAQGSKAGIKVEIPHPLTECSVMPYDKPFEPVKAAKKYEADFR